jgi:erythromycin esterase
VYRITRGLEAQAKRQWKITDARSQEMGKNIEWWAKQYPNKKMVVWAHSGHLYRKGSPQVGINAGQVVSESFGKEYYMVHFTSNDGQFLDFVDMKVKDVGTTDDHSFEKIVTQASKTDLSFVNVGPQYLMAPELTDEKMGIMAADYDIILPLSLWHNYIDGVFVFKQITPARYK